MIGKPVVALAVALGLFAAPNFADRFIYHPQPLPSGWTPAAHGIRGEEVSLRAADGARLHALYVGPGALGGEAVAPRASVLFLHGNAGNLTYWAESAARLAERARVGVLLIDYRGFGRSEGRPSESGLYLDAEAGFDHLVERRGEAPGRVVLYGHSLGTGVAIETALRRPAAALILEAPYTSIPDVAGRALPWLDMKKVLSECYDSLSKAPRVKVPALIVHGSLDMTIPIGMGRSLAEALGGPCDFLEVPGAGHVGAPRAAGEAFYERVDALLERALAAPAASASHRRSRLF